MSARLSTRVRCVVAAAVITAGLAPGTVHAYLEDTSVGGRAIAMGSSALANVHDVSAYYWSPAGLADLPTAQVMVHYGQPYGVGELGIGAVAYAQRLFGSGVAVAWRRLSLENVYAEDVLSIGAGRGIYTHGPHRVSAGATFKLARVGFESFTDASSGQSVDYGSLAKGSLDLGLGWQTPWGVDFAWVGRDVLQPRYEFIAGSGGEKLSFRQEIAAAFRWNVESTITLGLSQIDDAGTTFNSGIEIWFYDVFAIRSGLANMTVITNSTDSPNDLSFTGGFGIKSNQWVIDATASTNRDLGAYYRASLMVPLPLGADR